MRIPNNIKIIRSNAKMSLRKLEEKTGIPICYLSEAERGRYLLNSIQAQNVCEVFNCSINLIYPNWEFYEED